MSFAVLHFQKTHNFFIFFWREIEIFGLFLKSSKFAFLFKILIVGIVLENEDSVVLQLNKCGNELCMI